MGEMRSRVSSLGTLTRPWSTCTIVRNCVLVCQLTGLEPPGDFLEVVPHRAMPARDGSIHT